ncbi:MAG TPA: hypothetical protein VFM13_05785 [Gaiellaceae bacterium]|nr:hypothetical protein [Gaiellaceae bacterium]
MHGALAPLLGVVAHGGLVGALVEALAALLILAIALAAWVGQRRDGEER